MRKHKRPRLSKSNEQAPMSRPGRRQTPKKSGTSAHSQGQEFGGFGDDTNAPKPTPQRKENAPSQRLSASELRLLGREDGTASSELRESLEITSLAQSGDGVGRTTDGRVLFVPMTVPGDRVSARVVRWNKRHGFAVAEAIETAGDGRTSPRCERFGECGGCEWQHLHYPQQIHWKSQILWQTLRRIGQIEHPKPPEILAASLAYGTRTRARMPIDAEGMPGFFRRNSSEVVEIKQCPVMSPALRTLHGLLRKALPELPLPIQEVRLLDVSDQLLLSLHLLPGRTCGDTKLRLFELWCAQLANECPDVRGASLWTEERLLGRWGESTLHHGEPAVFYRPEGFAQASFAQNQVLVEQVLSLLAPSAQSRIVEIYAGRGNFTLPLAAQGATILALDADEIAISDGQKAAANTDFADRVYFAPFRDEYQTLASLCETYNIWPQQLLLDPPRRGVSPQLLAQIIEMSPAQILYVSCDAATLARDLRQLLNAGYFIHTLRGVDMMPQTAHVEAVALLRKSSKG